MRSSAVVIFSILLVALAFYFLGKKNGSNNTNVAVVQNVSLIKEIAELGALSVNGSTNLKSTNVEPTNSLLSRFKNYFSENTLNINIPFTAKYGVDMGDKQLTIDTKDSIVYIYLPKSKLLSLQLKLDEVEAISKTGVFRSLSVEEYVSVASGCHASPGAPCSSARFSGLGSNLVSAKGFVSLANNPPVWWNWYCLPDV